jgi:NDP-sugar pyrophosphorylase family protein
VQPDNLQERRDQKIPTIFPAPQGYHQAMDAIILAAGLGTRLRPLTLKTPKPLLPVQGRPLLDWTLAALPPSVDRAIVVTHYLADQILAYMQRQERVQHWLSVFQEKPNGTGDALRSCVNSVKSDHFLVINGDDLYGARDLAELVSRPAGLLVYPVNDPSRFGIAFAKPDGTLERLVEKPSLEGRQLANTGAYLFPRAVLDIVPVLSARGEYEITDHVSALAKRQPVQVVQADFWLPIGSTEDLEKAQTMNLEVRLTADR